MRNLSRARRNSPTILPIFGRLRGVFRFLVDRKAPWAPKLLLLFAVLYAVSPIDAIPDIAPIVTWIDDAGLLAYALGYTLSAVDRHESGEEAASPVEAPASAL